MSGLADPALTSSEFMDWETPQVLFDELNERHRFDLDAAATSATAKVGNHRPGPPGRDWYGPDHPVGWRRDSLTLRGDPCWTAQGRMGAWLTSVGLARSVWLNPPYGRGQMDKWMSVARRQTDHGATVVVLTFARTDTKWWHDHVPHATQVRFLRGRLKFRRDGIEEHPAPAPSVLITFTPAEGPPAMVFG